MSISVFLSYPVPFLQNQLDFIDLLKTYLRERGFEARTLGVTDYDMREPLTAIRRLMLESNGLITIAFKRTLVERAFQKPSSDLDFQSKKMSNCWYTSPYCQIEPAMAFQIGLPILILREKGVVAEGVLEKGVTGTYLPEFDLSKGAKFYLESDEWKQIIGEWEGYVRKVVYTKGLPPKLY